MAILIYSSESAPSLPSDPFENFTGYYFTGANGASFDTEIWTDRGGNYSPTIQTNRGVFSLGTGQQGGVNSNFKLSGDFEIWIYFQGASYADNGSNYVGMYAMDGTSSADYGARVYTTRFSSVGKWGGGIKSAGVWSAVQNNRYITYGYLGIKRVGTTMYSQRKAGTGPVETIISGDVGAAPDLFVLLIGNCVVDGANCQFDNFVITSGTVISA